MVKMAMMIAMKMAMMMKMAMRMMVAPGKAGHAKEKNVNGVDG